MNDFQVTFVITCMGRAHHLEKSLPFYLAQTYSNYQVIVVDWSSPDNLQEILKPYLGPRCSCCKVDNQKYFNLAEARNTGAEFIKHKCDWLAFFDADILIPRDFLQKNLSRMKPKCFLHSRKTENGDLSIWGSCIVEYQAWRDTQYNKNMQGYGHEDNEFYNMLLIGQYRMGKMDTSGVTSIPHDETIRIQFYDPKLSLTEQKKANLTKIRTPLVYK